MKKKVIFLGISLFISMNCALGMKDKDKMAKELIELFVSNLNRPIEKQGFFGMNEGCKKEYEALTSDEKEMRHNIYSIAANRAFKTIQKYSGYFTLEKKNKSE